jgi:hypothetical protein
MLLQRGAVALLSLLAALGWLNAAAAAPLSPTVQVSGATPFVGCTLDEPDQQPGQYFPASEVEPRLAVNPQNPLNLVGVFQQDRWSNSGARGLMAAASFDGGATWRATALPGFSRCTGGSLYRASDPWVSFAPNGNVYALGLVLDLFPDGSAYARSGMAAIRSTDGGLTWDNPIPLVVEAGGALHDKGSIAADPTDASSQLVYAVWDYLEEPANLLGNKWATFSRSTDAGRTWEGPRVIYDPGQGNSTVGHQLLVLPDGTLLDFSPSTLRLGALRASPNATIHFSPGSVRRTRARRGEDRRADLSTSRAWLWGARGTRTVAECRRYGLEPVWSTSPSTA